MGQTLKIEMTVDSAVAALEQWYQRVHRKLPWRESHDAYRIWISEVMLQQTQVTTVIPYFHRFLEKFPTVQHLAAADTAEVLAAWSGLGYYSRARNLQRGAQTVVEKFDGKLPRDRARLLEIPGIGPYTAGAIASIAFDEPAPIVDGNVQRVFARFLGWMESLATARTQRFFWEQAQSWVDAAASPRVLNQALMELGATVCIKGAPRCDVCPVRPGCVALREGKQEQLPVKKERRAMESLWWLAIVLESEGKLFLKQNRSGEWWADLWDFPRWESRSRRALDRRAPQVLAELDGVVGWESLAVQKHTVTHHRIFVVPFYVRLTRPLTPPAGLVTTPGRWWDREALANLPVSSLVRKVVHSSLDARQLGLPLVAEKT